MQNKQAPLNRLRHADFNRKRIKISPSMHTYTSRQKATTTNTSLGHKDHNFDMKESLRRQLLHKLLQADFNAKKK